MVDSSQASALEILLHNKTSLMLPAAQSTPNLMG